MMNEHVSYCATKGQESYIVYLYNDKGKLYRCRYSVNRYTDILAKKLAYLSLQNRRKYYDYFEINKDDTVSFYVYTKLYGICRVDIDQEDFEIIAASKISIYKSKYTYYATTARGSVHRLVLGLKDSNTKVVVDHIGKNGLNNKKSNLRAVPTSINNKNSKLRKDNSTGYRGVYCEPGIKYSTIFTDLDSKVHKKSFSIKKYGEEQAKQLAIQARLEAEEKYGYKQIDESSETNPNKHIGYVVI